MFLDLNSIEFLTSIAILWWEDISICNPTERAIFKVGATEPFRPFGCWIKLPTASCNSETYNTRNIVKMERGKNYASQFEEHFTCFWRDSQRRR